MSSVAYIESILSELWKLKVFASTRPSSAQVLDRPGRAMCGSKTNQYNHLKSDQGPNIIRDLHSDVCPVGKADPIKFDGLFPNGAAQPQRRNKTSSNSEQIRACTGQQNQFSGSIAPPEKPFISELFQFDRPSVEGGHLKADPTAINPQETINPQNVRASTGS